MAYVNVPKDLNKVKTKVAFNLTKRQLIWFSVAAATSVPVYFLTRDHIGNTGAMLILIMISSPSFLMAMYEKNGLPFEAVVKMVVRSRFICPKIRCYRNENLYDYAVKQYDFEKEVREIVASEQSKQNKRKTAKRN